MLIPVLWNICTFTFFKDTLRERWLFQCQRAKFRKDAIFCNKISWKIAGKAVLGWFLGKYQLTAWNLKWPLKSGIIWSRWLPGFKMLFPALKKVTDIIKEMIGLLLQKSLYQGVMDVTLIFILKKTKWKWNITLASLRSCNIPQCLCSITSRQKQLVTLCKW